MKSFTRPQITASFLILISGIAILYSWLFLLKNQESSDIFTPPIIHGEQAYNIMLEGTCVGTFNTVLKENQEKGWDLTVTGKINSSFNNQIMSTNFSVEAYLNYMKQLGGSTVILKNKLGSISLITTGVNPFKAGLILKSSTSNWSKTIELPGPVMLKRLSRNSSVLAYAGLKEALPDKNTGKIHLPLSPDIEIKTTTSDKQCQNSQEAFDISGYLAMISALSKLRDR